MEAISLPVKGAQQGGRVVSHNIENESKVLRKTKRERMQVRELAFWVAVATCVVAVSGSPQIKRTASLPILRQHSFSGPAMVESFKPPILTPPESANRMVDSESVSYSSKGVARPYFSQKRRFQGMPQGEINLRCVCATGTVWVRN